MMHGRGKSDGSIVPTKSPNKAATADAEAMEGKGPAGRNTSQDDAARTQRRTTAQNGLARVREAARRDRKARLSALLHHVTHDRLRTAYESLNKRAAVGIDDVTWAAYGQDLERNIQELHAKLQRGAYRAKPTRRVYIPKTDGRQRALGISSLEDKLVQRAVGGVLNAIYETDFLGFSYGFRPERSQHHALDALAVGIERKKVSWVLDADIRSFFDTLDHGWLMKFIEHRIADKRVLRLIQKWLNAGVLEDGQWSATDEGTPQGATISPLLANVYLHYVFDLWVQQWRKRRAQGNVIVVRYADDFVVGFQHETDARRFLDELRERLRSFQLELHPKKTRLIRFGARAAQQRKQRGEGKPETFCFLGFVHICSRTRAGNFLLERHTAAARMHRKIREIRQELRRRLHAPVPKQGEWLGRVLRGYYAYHAIPTNSRRLSHFRFKVEHCWYQALRRRSQRDRTTWKRVTRLSKRWLPSPQILHPWPSARFNARTASRSPVR